MDVVRVPVICVNVAVGLLAVAVVVAVGYLDDESVSRWWWRWVLDSSGTDDGDEVAAEKPKKKHAVNQQGYDYTFAR